LLTSGVGYILHTAAMLVINLWPSTDLAIEQNCRLRKT